MNKLFFFKDIDSHYVIYFLGIRILLKHKCPIKFKKTTEYALNTTEVRTPKVIVSLTTYPARLPKVHDAINSVMHQTMKPDKIILWLEEEKFPNKLDDVGDNVKELMQYGLEIRFCQTLRSFCKYVPAMIEYPDDIIITIDDDSYYEENLVENLYKAYLKDPKNVYSRRVVRLEEKNGELFEVSPRKYLYKDDFTPTYLNQLIGASGVLYPPHVLHKDTTNIEMFKRIIPTQDDVWTWAMAARNHTKTQLVDGHSAQIYVMEGTQDTGLININKRGGAGIFLEDAYRLMFKEFPELKDIVLK